MRSSRRPARAAPRAARPSGGRRGARAPAALTASTSGRTSAELRREEEREEEDGGRMVHRVYIEHTDAFQVCYHANYLLFLARDRHARLAAVLGAELADERLVRAERVRWRGAARLGSRLVVRSEPVEAERRPPGAAAAAALAVRWEQRIFEVGDGGAEDELLLEATVVGALASLPAGAGADACARLGCPVREPAAAVPAPLVADRRCSRTTRVRLWPDERAGAPSWDARVLRWFERARTECIGSAAALRRLQEAGRLVVVAAVKDLRLADDMDVGPGEPHVDVRAHLSLRLGRTTMVFRHAAVAAGGRVLATAEVTCVCVDAVGFGVCALPEHFLPEVEL